MYTRILLPLDGSEIAEQALPYARTLAASLKTQVELMEVVEIHTHPGAEKHRYFEIMIEDAVRSSQEYLKRVAKTFSGDDVKCTVEKGMPEEIIIAKAAQDDTLIAMATHGRSGVNRWLMGSVAEKVLHGADNDVLLIRATGQIERKGAAQLKRLVVPLDGSEVGENALPRVVELAKQLNLEVILLRVYLMPGVAYPTGDYAPDWKLLDQEMRERATEYLEGKSSQLRSEGMERVSFRVLEGSAGETIIDFAQASSDSLIAMSTHGASGIGRWLLGSITERVVRHSDGAVLVVRAKREVSAHTGSEVRRI